MRTIGELLFILAGFALLHGAQAGDVTGKVTLLGEPPPEIPIDLERHRDVAEQHPDGLTTRHYRVGPEGGLRDVLVYLRHDFEDYTFETPEEPAVLDHVNGLFEPYVQGIQTGQPLHLKCTDRTICSFVTMSQVNQSFAFAPFDKVLSRTFAKAEPEPLRFKCDLHLWNSADLGVFAHPFFAVTDEQGRFVIRDVPAGEYHLEIFHRKGGVHQQSIVVTENQPTRAAFEIQAR